MGAGRLTERATEKVTGPLRGRGKFCWDNPIPREGFSRNILPSWGEDRQQGSPLVPPGPTGCHLVVDNRNDNCAVGTYQDGLPRYLHPKVLDSIAAHQHFQALRWLERCSWPHTTAMWQVNMGAGQSTERATGPSGGRGPYRHDNQTLREASATTFSPLGT